MIGPRREPLAIAPAPHVASGASVERIMRDVVLALAPASAFAIHLFGLAAVATLTAAVASCLATEAWLARRHGAGRTLRDWSAAVTGLIYGLTLPPGLPLWMTVLGGVAAIGLGKFLFGGLGANVFNPALVGRALLQAAFPAAMTTWHAPLLAERWSALPASVLALPFARPAYDGLSGATPLAARKFAGEEAPALDLLLGLTGGSLGETSSVLLLAGGAYLALRRAIDWRIPLALLGTVAGLGAIAHGLDPLRYPGAPFMLLAGGLMLGALFMATDPVASPATGLGVWIYGGLIGALVVAIRYWGGLPEGVMYAILIGNASTPLIDRWTQPRPMAAGGGDG